MASLGTLGLNRQYTILRIKFSGSGTTFKIIPWGITSNFTPSDNFADYPFVKSVTMVSLSLGAEFVNFVPYDTEDITSVVRNPIRILQSAVLNRRNRRDRASVAWERMFPSMGSSFAGSPINMAIRYLVPVIVFSEDNLQYQNPRGLGQTKVLLALSKTAIGGIVGCIMRDGLQILGPNNIVMCAQPKQSKYSITEGVSAKQYVVSTLEYQISPDVLKVMEGVFESNLSNNWDSVIAPIDTENQLELLFASSVPKSAVVYALQHTEWSSKIPESYLKAGLEELALLESGHATQGYYPAQENVGYMDIPPQAMYPQNFMPRANVPGQDAYVQSQGMQQQGLPQQRLSPQQGVQAPYAPNQPPVQSPQVQQQAPAQMQKFAFPAPAANEEAIPASGAPQANNPGAPPANIPGTPNVLYAQNALTERVGMPQNLQAGLDPEQPVQPQPGVAENYGEQQGIPLPTNVKGILDSLKNRLG